MRPNKVSNEPFLPSIRKYVATFLKNCEQYQRSKVLRHTKSALVKYEPSKERLPHTNIDIIGLCVLSEYQPYCPNIIERFSRWPEVALIPDICAETVERLLLTYWISQLEYYHPQASGIIERFHKTLKIPFL